MGSLPSKQSHPPIPTKEINYCRLFANTQYPMYETIRMDFQHLSNDERQYYIIRPLFQAGLQYIYIDEHSIIIYNVVHQLFLQLFSTLKLVEYKFGVETKRTVSDEDPIAVG